MSLFKTTKNGLIGLVLGTSTLFPNNLNASELHYEQPAAEIMLAEVPSDVVQKTIKMKASNGNLYDYDFETIQKRVMQSKKLSEEQANEHMRNDPQFKQYFKSPSGANLDAGWRSALIPGWGQMHNGQSTKAYALGGLTLGLLVSGFITEGMSENAGREYETAKSDFDTKYSAWESAANLNHGIVTAFGIAYTWQLIDAFISKKTNISSRVDITPKGGVELAFTKKF